MTRREEFKKRFLGSIQIDRVLDVQKWVDNLKTVEDEQIKLAIMTANNHYAGRARNGEYFSEYAMTTRGQMRREKRG